VVQGNGETMVRAGSGTVIPVSHGNQLQTGTDCMQSLESPVQVVTCILRNPSRTSISS